MEVIVAIAAGAALLLLGLLLGVLIEARRWREASTRSCWVNSGGRQYVVFRRDVYMTMGDDRKNTEKASEKSSFAPGC